MFYSGKKLTLESRLVYDILIDVSLLIQNSATFRNLKNYLRPKMQLNIFYFLTFPPDFNILKLP